MAMARSGAFAIFFVTLLTVLVGNCSDAVSKKCKVIQIGACPLLILSCQAADVY